VLNRLLVEMCLVFVCGFKRFCFCVPVFVTLFAYVSLFIDPPIIFCSVQSLFFVCFLKLSLRMVYLTSGIDGKRLQKVGKGYF